MLEEELNQDIDELHFAPLKIDQQLATVAVIHQQHMRNIAQWLQANGITRATVAPDWMSIPCGFMAGDAQRVICRIDECRGWSAGRALAPVMFRAQLNEQDLPLLLTVVGIAPEELSAWAGADAERLTVTALPAITTYGEPEGNLLTGPWQPRVSYRKQWARWRVMILPVLLILVALAVERGVTLWSISEQVAQSRTQAEKKVLNTVPGAEADCEFAFPGDDGAEKISPAGRRYPAARRIVSDRQYPENGVTFRHRNAWFHL